MVLMLLCRIQTVVGDQANKIMESDSSGDINNNLILDYGSGFLFLFLFLICLKFESNCTRTFETLELAAWPQIQFDCIQVKKLRGVFAIFHVSHSHFTHFTTKHGCNVANPSYIGDTYCDYNGGYNTAECNWDGGDCCQQTCGGSGGCGTTTYQYYCLDPLYSGQTGSSCSVADSSWVGDHYCDYSGGYNTAECNWDGGDCCAQTCGGYSTCGTVEYPYNCLDPLYTANNPFLTCYASCLTTTSALSFQYDTTTPVCTTPVPTSKPTTTTIPSTIPTTIPSTIPSQIPSKVPSITPSKVPTTVPSKVPSIVPTIVPSTIPSIVPSIAASIVPSTVPSTIPSTIPSQIPSKVPSITPSTIPTTVPSQIPSTIPSTIPTIVPSQIPSTIPSTIPSQISSIEPSTTPSTIPTIVPSQIPSQMPSTIPSTLPSQIQIPSTLPSQMPSTIPTIVPSQIPSTIPSTVPSQMPSQIPSTVPSTVPTTRSSQIPTTLPTTVPSVTMITIPTVKPSTLPTTIPSNLPTTIPSNVPTRTPRIVPTIVPTTLSGTSTLSPSVSQQVIVISYSPDIISDTGVIGISTAGFFLLFLFLLVLLRRYALRSKTVYILDNLPLHKLLVDYSPSCENNILSLVQSDK
eukprot:gene5710-11522_t